VANSPTIKPCRRTQSPVTRDSNVATIRPHAVNKTKYGTNSPVMTHAAAKVLKNTARNLRRSLSAALPMVLSPSRNHRRIYIQGRRVCWVIFDQKRPGSETMSAFPFSDRKSAEAACREGSFSLFSGINIKETAGSQFGGLASLVSTRSRPRFIISSTAFQWQGRRKPIFRSSIAIGN
jgi:hypothetical protein